MAKYPIVKNVNDIDIYIKALIQKLVNNLQAKGVTGVSISMTLSQLIDKVLEVKYTPLANRSRSIKVTLDSLITMLEQCRSRLKLNLEVLGVTGLTNSMTLNVLVDKILTISLTPQYTLYPTELTLNANGHEKEFYFNTTDAVAITFEKTGDFTINSSGLTGPGNFILKVTAPNNTTASGKSGTIVIKFDNGKFPNRTVILSQNAGVRTNTMTGTLLSTNRFSASGVPDGNAYGNNSIATGGTYKTYWNGIEITSTYYDTNMPGCSMQGSATGFTITNNKLYATNRTTTTGAERSIKIAPVYNGTVGTEVTIYQDKNEITGGTFLHLTDGTSDLVNFPANGGTNWYNFRHRRSFSSGSTEDVTIGGGENRNAAISLNSGSVSQNSFSAINRDGGISPKYYGNFTCNYVYDGYTMNVSVPVSQAANEIVDTIWGEAGSFCSGLTLIQWGREVLTSGQSRPTQRTLSTNSDSCKPTVNITATGYVYDGYNAARLDVSFIVSTALSRSVSVSLYGELINTKTGASHMFSLVNYNVYGNQNAEGVFSVALDYDEQWSDYICKFRQRSISPTSSSTQLFNLITN